MDDRIELYWAKAGLRLGAQVAISLLVFNVLPEMGIAMKSNENFIKTVTDFLLLDDKQGEEV